MTYMTVTQAKAYIGGTSGDNDDALLALLITNAETFIEGYTNRNFEATIGTALVASNRTFGMQDVVDDMLILDRDLCAIVSVTNGDSDVLTTSEYVTVPANDTPYYAIKLRKFSNLYWTYTDDPEDEIIINGSWGYSETPPADILQATYDIVKTVYRSRDSNTDAGRTFISGGVIITPAEVPKMTLLTLNRYRRA